MTPREGEAAAIAVILSIVLLIGALSAGIYLALSHDRTPTAEFSR